MLYITFLRAVTYFSGALAIPLNLFLLYAVRKRADKSSGVNLISQSISVTSICYTMSLVVYIPTYYSSPGMLAFIPASPLAHHYTLMQIAIYTWLLMIVGTMVTILISFVYRWTLFVRPKLTLIIDRFRLIPIIIILYSSALLGLCLWIFNSPDELRPQLADALSAEFPAINFSTNFFWGIGMDYLHPVVLDIGVIGIFVLWGSAFTAAFYCGYGIQNTIRTHQFSDRARITHVKTLKLLIAQLVTPLILFFVPCSFNLSAMIGRFSIGQAPKVLVLGFVLLPVANPLVAVLFTDSYRRFALRQQTTGSVAAVNSRVDMKRPSNMDKVSRRSS